MSPIQPTPSEPLVVEGEFQHFSSKSHPGRIYPKEEFEKNLATPPPLPVKKKIKPQKPYVVQVNLTQLSDIARKLVLSQKKKVSRNSPCPCGSGKRFKRCHMDQ